MRRIDYKNITLNDINNYLKIFDLEQMQLQWEKLRPYLVAASASAKAEKIYKNEIKKILIAPYKQLVAIYNDYTDSHSRGLVNPAIHDELGLLFNYSGGKATYCKVMQPSIASFFMGIAEKLNIHTCFYCETGYVNVYSIKKTKCNHFDLDHFLPKSKCPIIGLSFYNFVPSCSVCNEKLKREKLLGNSHLLYSSPTSKRYNFDKYVKIRLCEKDGYPLEYIASKDEVSIEFCQQGDVYKDEIEELHYKERYEYHKQEAIRLFNLVCDYPDSMLEEIASLFGKNKTKEEVANEIFNGGYQEDDHPRVFEKLHRDIIAQRKGEC